jgi:hypothetical protein
MSNLFRCFISDIATSGRAQFETLTATEIGGLPAIGVTLLISDDANVSYSTTQTAAILSSGLKPWAVGSYTVTENFDSLTLSGFTIATPKAHLADFKFT